MKKRVLISFILLSSLMCSSSPRVSWGEVGQGIKDCGVGVRDWYVDLSPEGKSAVHFLGGGLVGTVASGMLVSSMGKSIQKTKREIFLLRVRLGADADASTQMSDLKTKLHRQQVLAGVGKIGGYASFFSILSGLIYWLKAGEIVHRVNAAKVDSDTLHLAFNQDPSYNPFVGRCPKNLGFPYEVHASHGFQKYFVEMRSRLYVQDRLDEQTDTERIRHIYEYFHTNPVFDVYKEKCKYGNYTYYEKFEVEGCRAHKKKAMRKYDEKRDPFFCYGFENYATYVQMLRHMGEQACDDAKDDEKTFSADEIKLVKELLKFNQDDFKEVLKVFKKLEKEKIGLVEKLVASTFAEQRHAIAQLVDYEIMIEDVDRTLKGHEKYMARRHPDSAAGLRARIASVEREVAGHEQKIVEHEGKIEETKNKCGEYSEHTKDGYSRDFWQERLREEQARIQELRSEIQVKKWDIELKRTRIASLKSELEEEEKNPPSRKEDLFGQLIQERRQQTEAKHAALYEQLVTSGADRNDVEEEVKRIVTEILDVPREKINA